LCQSTESSVLPEIGLVVADQDLRRHTEPHYRLEPPVDLNPELPARLALLVPPKMKATCMQTGPR
jgi:hypothetical protein